MLVGYEANNAMRDSHELGDFCRDLIAGIADKHVGSFRALLFSTRTNADYRKYFSGNSNVSTYLPIGISKMLPEGWIRYRLNPMLKAEKVKLFHGLNDELPYGIGRDIKTVITCFGLDRHNRNSLVDALAWRFRMRYAFRASDAIVAVNNEVKQQLVDKGVNPDKIVVISSPSGNPYELTDGMIDQYFELYNKLLD